MRKGRNQTVRGDSFLVCCRSVFEITSLLFFFVLNVFFIFFLLSWQWLLMFATFSFGFLSCFLHAAAALALFSDAFVVDFLHISADVVLADFSFFFSKKERCILSIEVCVTFCGGEGGVREEKSGAD